MKRRSFLSMIGAVATVPVLPALPSVAAVAPVNQYTYGLAALHAGIEPGLPVDEMMRRFRLSSAQAEALADRLVSDGLATRNAGVVKSKRMFVQNRGFGHRAERARPRATRHSRPDVSPLLAHLHDMCTACGLPLSPRALIMRAFP